MFSLTNCTYSDLNAFIHKANTIWRGLVVHLSKQRISNVGSLKTRQRNESSSALNRQLNVFGNVLTLPPFTLAGAELN